VFAGRVGNARSMALGPQATVFAGSQYVGTVHVSTIPIISLAVTRPPAISVRLKPDATAVSGLSHQDWLTRIIREPESIRTKTNASA
jgi:hypothetical protein